MSWLDWIAARRPAPLLVRRIVVTCKAGTLIDTTPEMLRVHLALANSVGPAKLAELERQGILSIYLFDPASVSQVSLGFLDLSDSTAPDIGAVVFPSEAPRGPESDN